MTTQEIITEIKKVISYDNLEKEHDIQLKNGNSLIFQFEILDKRWIEEPETRDVPKSGYLSFISLSLIQLNIYNKDGEPEIISYLVDLEEIETAIENEIVYQNI